MDELSIKCIDNKNIALPLVWNVFLEFEAPEYSEDGMGDYEIYL